MPITIGGNRNQRDALGRFVRGNQISRGHGRPPNRCSLTDHVRKTLENDPALLAAIVERWLKDAKDGKFAALQELLNRTEGSVPQFIQSCPDTKLEIEFPVWTETNEAGAGVRRPADKKKETSQ